jgi:hypothetical protein
MMAFLVHNISKEDFPPVGSALIPYVEAFSPLETISFIS